MRAHWLNLWLTFLFAANRKLQNDIARPQQTSLALLGFCISPGSEATTRATSTAHNGHEHLRCLRRKQVRKRRAEEREQRRRSARSGVRVVARGLRSDDAVHGGAAGSQIGRASGRDSGWQ